MPPDFGDLVQIQIHFGFAVHQLKPLSIGLHQAIFDAIVNHLDEVACAAGTDMSPTTIHGGR